MAAAMAECGAFVYLNGRQADVLETRRQELAEKGWKVGVAAFDVTDAEASGPPSNGSPRSRGGSISW